ncbi:hypothetical protein J5N97_010796 [Dioscorea zingiberensis]|uniref:Uncharacterized protein n=1 Tax=Dioscorea zingiberensis TaxID=325984 RepID=A0A9D5CZT4_9LILI|nr:hypothetical protein J5N97_010796 [Dioscorea zingiberensis]
MPQARSPIIGRPPLALSPRRLRPRPPRCVPAPQTPLEKLVDPSSKTEINPNLPPGREMIISSELLAIAKGAKEDLISEDEDIRIAFTPASVLFERGRLYDLYSARRNDRLKRKKREVADEAVSEDPAAAVELGKRRNQKKMESLRKSVPADFSVGRVGGSKEMKKSARQGSAVRSSVDFGRRASSRLTRRI